MSKASRKKYRLSAGSDEQQAQQQAIPELAPKVTAKVTPNGTPKVTPKLKGTSAMNDNGLSDIPVYEAVKPVPQASLLQRRAADNTPTIDSVRDLLLGDTIKQGRREMETIERKTHDQLAELRVELGDRVDRVVRALSTVNQAVHKEFGAREQAVRESADKLSTQMEDRMSALEAKIFTHVADMERKLSATHTAANDKLVSQLADTNKRFDTKVAKLGLEVETQLQSFGTRITTELAEVDKSVAEARAETDKEVLSLSGEVGNKIGAVETQLTAELSKLRGDIGKSASDLRGELYVQVGEQKALLNRTHAESQSKLQDHLQGIEGRKVSRTDFSTLLHELAARLDDDETQAKGQVKGKS